MKKLVSVLVLALVASFVFAGFSAGVGVGYDVAKVTYKMAEPQTVADYTNNYSAKGISLSADFGYEFDNGIYVFDSFVLAPKAKTSMTNIATNGAHPTEVKSSTVIKNYLGVGYVLPVDGNFKLAAGVSFLAEGFKYEVVYDYSDPSCSLKNFGLALNVKGIYDFANNVSVYLNGNVDFGFANRFTKANETTTVKTKDLTPAFGIKLGVAYNF